MKVSNISPRSVYTHVREQWDLNMLLTLLVIGVCVFYLFEDGIKQLLGRLIYEYIWSMPQ